MLQTFLLIVIAVGLTYYIRSLHALYTRLAKALPSHVLTIYPYEKGTAVISPK